MAIMYNMCFLLHSLKPANIFLDSLSNVKLGDYGLAVKKTALLKKDNEETTPSVNKTTDHLPRDPDQAGLGSKASADGTHGTDEDLTRGVGTALYSAPEQGESLS